MTSERQIEANRNNAGHSTGPRSPDGKAVVARNAIKHGAFASLPVIPGVERAEDWEAHRAGILDSLAPAGALETRLAERVALLLWRLDRVSRFEAAVISAAHDAAADDPPPPSALDEALGRDAGTARLPGARKDLEDSRRRLGYAESGLRAFLDLPNRPDDADLSDDAFAIFELATNGLPEDSGAPWFEDVEFLRAVGAPAGDDFEDVRFTAAMVRRGLALLGKYAGTPAAEFHERTRRELEKHRDALRGRLEQLSAEVRELQRRRRTEVARKQARRSLPDAAAADKLLRYEGHLSRQLYQAMHELQRLQADRAGKPVPPPLAVDVGVEVTGTATPDTA